jgi:hypothetical protein
MMTPTDLVNRVTHPKQVLSDPDYWHRLVRGTAGERLRILAAPNESAGSYPDVVYRRARDEVTRDGYTGLADFLSPARSAALADASLALLRSGWPAPFLFMFDEPWHLARRVAHAMRSSLNDDLVLRYEMFVYCVDSTMPFARARGIPAHRDAPGAGFDSAGEWSLPRHGTAWLALTDTNADNGCICVVPASAEGEITDPIREELGIPLEVSAGTLLMWGGHVAHWGGRHDAQKAKGPRVAFTCVASVIPTWGLPELSLSTAPDANTLPDMETRLGYIAALLRGFGPPEPGSAVDSVLARC